jgi:hypothetical protein
MDWKPKARILADSVGIEPAKPSKPTSVGFGGPASGESQKIGAQKFEETAQSEPAKPSEPGSVGFEGSTPTESPKIEVARASAEMDQAAGVLGRAGVHLMELDGVPTVGVWSDRDGPEIRAAFRTLGWDRKPVRYLDGTATPTGYTVRLAEGESVPMGVLREMERQPVEPWKVRDRMLKELGWNAKGIPWAEWRRRC